MIADIEYAAKLLDYTGVLLELAHERILRTRELIAVTKTERISRSRELIKLLQGSEPPREW